MSTLSRKRLYRVVSLCAFVGAAGSGFIGGALLADSKAAHDGAMYKILVLGFGILYLIVSSAIGSFGLIAWKTSKSIRLD